MIKIVSKSILIADDEYGFRFPLIIFLRNNCFNVLEASNKMEICNNISKANLLIMDVIFPVKKEGIEIVKEIRKYSDEKIKNIPVIFNSVLDENMCADELKDIDRRSYIWLQKPYELSEMVKAISKLI